MNRVFVHVLALLVLVLSAAGADLEAQNDAEGDRHREGFWIGFGAGGASGAIDCGPCGTLESDDPWQGGRGFGLYLAMGYALRPDLLVGGELNLYGRRNSSLERDATLGGVTAVVQFFPLAGSGLFLKGGAGAGGSILAGGPGLVESDGWAAQAGAGYDVQLGPRFALAPFANFVQVFSEGDPGRNRGAPVRGPRNPSYVQLGLGFHWY